MNLLEEAADVAADSQVAVGGGKMKGEILGDVEDDEEGDEEGDEDEDEGDYDEPTAEELDEMAREMFDGLKNAKTGKVGR